jgi:ABC-type transport system involved in cytochrome c biogenesis ATPase subunit
LETWLQEHAAAGGMVLLTTHHEFARQGFPCIVWMYLRFGQRARMGPE